MKPLKEILEYMNPFQLLPKTLSEPEKILELRKLLRVGSLSVIPKIPYNAAYRAQISNNVAVDAYVLYAWQCLCEQLKPRSKREWTNLHEIFSSTKVLVKIS